MIFILETALNSDNLFLYVIIILLVAASAFFSSCETAITTANKIRLQTKAENGSRGAERALKLISNYDDTLAAILIGNNIVNILASSLATVAALSIVKNGPVSAEDIAVTISTVVLTVIILIFGEITPKSRAKRKADTYLVAVSLPLYLIVLLLTPLEKLCNVIKHSGGEEDVPTEEEMEKILEESMDRGQLDEDETEMAKNALRLDEISVAEILVPRVDIFAVEKNIPMDELVTTLTNQQFSRVPVFEGNIDKIIGIVYERDVLERLAKGEELSMDTLLRPALFVPATTKLVKVLSQFRQERIHMAVVNDEFGGTAGIVTMEDIFEELVGDIRDENDTMQRFIVKKGTKYEINAKMSLNDLFKETDWPRKWCEETEASTVGGWVMQLVQKIPSKNEVFEFDDFTVKIKGVKGRRITAVEMEIKENEE